MATNDTIPSGKNSIGAEQWYFSTEAKYLLLHHTHIHSWVSQSPKCVPECSPPRVCDILTISQVPNETFKAAAHLVVTGHRRKFPDVKIILAHLGGSAPFLAARVAVLSNHMGCGLSPEEILDDFKTFYYETALSAYEVNLIAMENFVEHDHILFGTDFPGE